MAAGNYDFTIEQGATLKTDFIWKDETGSVVDLTGGTARMQIRPSLSSETIVLELTTENGGLVIGGETGKVTMNISASQSSAITRGGVYDLEVVVGPVVTRLLQGVVSISKEVTR